MQNEELKARGILCIGGLEVDQCTSRAQTTGKRMRTGWLDAEQESIDVVSDREDAKNSKPAMILMSAVLARPVIFLDQHL